jgi:hypothetical protein
VAEAGWNQVAADWRLMLSLGEGFGLARPDGTVIGSAVALPYQRFGWISMVLVTEAWRRQGAARFLVARCLAALAARGVAAVLDATPAGRPVYAALGFAAGPEIVRWHRAPASAPPPPPDMALLADIDAIAARDRAAFGADRGAVLADLHARCPDAAVATAAGHARARDGRLATQLGPIVAENAAAAATLLAAQAARLPGALLVDAFPDPAFDAALAALGFAPLRRFTRMSRGIGVARHRTVFAAAGPELG